MTHRPEAMKAATDGPLAETDVFWSRGQIGFIEFPPREREKYPWSWQRLVRRHPGWQRKTLYLSRTPCASRLAGFRECVLLYHLNTHDPPRIRLQPQAAGR